jgi:unsaturated rhamnogalacturonyl hydrolase
MLAGKLVNKFYELNNQFSTLDDAWGPYTLDLTFEAMLVYAQVSGNQSYIDSVLRIMYVRNLKPTDTVPYRQQPFGSISFELFRATGDSIYLPAFLFETEKMFREVKRNSLGAVLHGYLNRNGMLIDYVQEYASRLAKANTVNDHVDYFEEAVRQFELYDSLVRFPDSGLYSQGLGFLNDPEQLSPSAWSRGQGWMLRGLVSTMVLLPEGSELLPRMQKLLIPFVDALIKHQNKSGFWHQLVDAPYEDSSPETSGTAFIAYYLALAINHGLIEGDYYRDAAEKAIRAVKSQVQPDGSVLNGCPGPGPIISVDNYFRTPGTTNEAHLFGTALFALAGELLLN